jgi:hypothetical protein
MTNSFFATPNYNVNAINNALKSNENVPTGVSREWTWAGGVGAVNPPAGENVWKDLNSGRNTIQILSDMKLKIKVEGRYRLEFKVNSLVKQAVIVHKFDAFDAQNVYLFTLITRRQVINSSSPLADQPFVLRGNVEQIEETQTELDKIKYFIRRGAGQYRD